MPVEPCRQGRRRWGVGLAGLSTRQKRMSRWFRGVPSRIDPTGLLSIVVRSCRIVSARSAHHRRPGAGPRHPWSAPTPARALVAARARRLAQRDRRRASHAAGDRRRTPAGCWPGTRRVRPVLRPPAEWPMTTPTPGFAAVVAQRHWRDRPGHARARDLAAGMTRTARITAGHADELRGGRGAGWPAAWTRGTGPPAEPPPAITTGRAQAYCGRPGSRTDPARRSRRAVGCPCAPRTRRTRPCRRARAGRLRPHPVRRYRRTSRKAAGRGRPWSPGLLRRADGAARRGRPHPVGRRARGQPGRAGHPSPPGRVGQPAYRRR